MKRKFKILIWIFTSIVLVFGLLPYRYTFKRPSSNSTNVLIADYQSCTCCGELTVVDGNLVIPDSLKSILKEGKFEITVSNIDDFSFNDNRPQTYDLLTGNEFLIEGSVVGADRKWLRDCGAFTRFEVKSWKLITYHPRFLLLDAPLILGYLFLSGFLVIVSILILIIRTKKTE